MSDNCERALARLEEFMDNEVAEADAATIRAHLADCDGCMDEARMLETLRRLMRRSCVECAPDELRVRIQTQITTLRIQFRA